MPYFICNRIRKNWEHVSNGYRYIINFEKKKRKKTVSKNILE